MHQVCGDIFHPLVEHEAMKYTHTHTHTERETSRHTRTYMQDNIQLTFPIYTLHTLHLHLADAFIQSDLQCIHPIHFSFISICVPWESNPQPFALLTQCSTTEPHEPHIYI